MLFLFDDDFVFEWLGQNVDDVDEKHGKDRVNNHCEDCRQLKYVGALEYRGRKDASKRIQQHATHLVDPIHEAATGISAEQFQDEAQAEKYLDKSQENVD
jgi:hypothetical protein